MVMFRLMLHLMIAINHKLKNEKDAQIKPPQEAYGNQIQILMCIPLVNYRLLMRLKVSIFCFFFVFCFFLLQHIVSIQDCLQFLWYFILATSIGMHADGQPSVTENVTHQPDQLLRSTA